MPRVKSERSKNCFIESQYTTGMTPSERDITMPPRMPPASARAQTSGTMMMAASTRGTTKYWVGADR